MIGESASPGDQQSRSAADEAAPPQPTPEPGQQPAQLPAGARLVVLAADRGARRLVRGALTANRAALARYGVRVADSIPASAADGPRTVTVVDPRTAEAELVGGTTDGSQTHLLLIIRPVRHAMVLDWYADLLDGDPAPYEEWLATHPVEAVSRAQPKMLRQLQQTVQPDRMSAVILHPSDAVSPLRTVEQLLGTPDLLTADDGTAGRLPTYGESELLRRLNEQGRERGWSAQTHDTYVRHGVAERLARRRPPAREQQVPTPSWASAQFSAATDELVQLLGSMDVAILGDPGTLDEPSSPGKPAQTATPSLPPRAVALALVGAIAATQSASRARTGPEPAARSAPGPAEGFQASTVAASGTPSTALLAILARRLLAKLRTRERTPAGAGDG